MDVQINYMMNHRISQNEINISNHIAWIHINNSTKKTSLTKGINTSRNLYAGCEYGAHAEMDLIKKIKYKIKTGQITKNFDIIVINVSRQHYLKNSKPCLNCINQMINFNKKSKYKIKHIYYSNSNGDIQKTS